MMYAEAYDLSAAVNGHCPLQQPARVGRNLGVQVSNYTVFPEDSAKNVVTSRYADYDCVASMLFGRCIIVVAVVTNGIGCTLVIAR